MKIGQEVMGFTTFAWSFRLHIQDEAKKHNSLRVDEIAHS